ncbi:Mitochondrial ATP synthase subunit G protein [Prunus dulcis]|uniref:Mitochondrial ATP synthase subunit G protein n=1 Tax=Prunus dulcis TaxID=3755 RepID=A0A4Y1RX38_PRUDU|nr:Mitochondrial ATP synthase subunit G protein [Prunus dulcis]
MASKLRQLQSKACQATQFVSKHGSTYYKNLLEQNKQYIQHPPTVEKCNELSKQLFYTRLARTELSYNLGFSGRSARVNENFIYVDYMLFKIYYSWPYRSFWKEVDYVKHLWKNRQDLKVKMLALLLCLGWSALHGFVLVRLWEGDLPSLRISNKNYLVGQISMEKGLFFLARPSNRREITLQLYPLPLHVP